MLWPIELPFQITLALWLGAILVAGIFAPKWGVKRLKSVLLGFLIGILLFIPACVGVKYILDPFRFGMFQYPNFAAVHDWRVQRYLPDAASEITIEIPVHGNGFRAKFYITKPALETWFEQSWEEGAKYSIISRKEAQDFNEPQEFYDLGWQRMPGAVMYVGPMEDDGGGYYVWYSEEEGIAYEDAGYW
jgi:hypothetical protein